MSATAFDRWWARRGLPKEGTIAYAIQERNFRSAFNAGRKSMRDELKTKAMKPMKHKSTCSSLNGNPRMCNCGACFK